MVEISLLIIKTLPEDTPNALDAKLETLNQLSVKDNPHIVLVWHSLSYSDSCYSFLVEAGMLPSLCLLFLLVSTWLLLGNSIPALFYGSTVFL